MKVLLSGKFPDLDVLTMKELIKAHFSNIKDIVEQEICKKGYVVPEIKLEIKEISNLSQALQICRREPDNIALVIVDFISASLSDFKFAQKINEAVNHQVKVFLWTPLSNYRRKDGSRKPFFCTELFFYSELLFYTKLFSCSWPFSYSELLFYTELFSCLWLFSYTERSLWQKYKAERKYYNQEIEFPADAKDYRLIFDYLYYEYHRLIYNYLHLN